MQMLYTVPLTADNMMAIVLTLSILPDILHLHFEHSHLIFCHTYFTTLAIFVLEKKK